MGFKYFSKEDIPSRTSWWLPRTRSISLKKAGRYINLNVTGWSVMKTILENPQEHLGIGSKNI